MKIHRTTILVLSLLILLSPGFFVFANIELSEVMYDLKSGSDDGREWVEVFNNSDRPVDFSTYKFFEADTNHKIISVQGDAKIPGMGYAVLVSNPDKFKIDWPNFSGIIFDSTFSLSNSGESLAIKNGDAVVDEYFYHSTSGGAGDGKSLQKINGTWVASAPTPGVPNKITYTAPTPKVAPVTTAKKISITPTPDPVKVQTITETPVVIPKEDSNSILFIIIFVVLLGVAGGGAYFIRRKKITPDSGEDFEILDS